MITNPMTIVTLFILLVWFIFWLEKQKFMNIFFRYFPPVIWCYFLPMIASSLGIIPDQSPLYTWMKNHLLPASLILLMISANIPAIIKLGKMALLMMLFGTIGIMVGGPIALFIFRSHLPPNAWMGLGALSGSWIGGSANMIAIKEGLNVPADIFSPMIIVDTVVGYSWMAVMIALSAFQDKFDRWNKADRAVIDEVNARISACIKEKTCPTTLNDFVTMLGLAFGLGYLCLRAGNYIPPIGDMITSFTWVIIIVTAVGLILSFTPLARLEEAGASKLGYVFLYLLLTSIGAQANLRSIIEAPVFILVGVVWIAIHASILLLGAKILRSPMFFFAASSQACVGGTATAPIVSAVYQSALASVGLLLAVLGNIIGTYLGFVCAYLCKLVSQL